MIVTIDTEKMFKLGITPDEYTLLQLIQSRGLVSARKLVQMTPSLTPATLERLVEKRLIHNLNLIGEMDVSRIMLRNTFIGEAKKDDLFDELLQEYPSKVTRPDGSTDWLKTDLTRCRKQYTLLVKKDEVLHKHIMACLRFELSERRMTNKMLFMKRLPKWLATEEWKVWEQQLNESPVTETTQLGYGLKLI